MRKHFVDNLRWIAVMGLVPYHTIMLYNTFESFYVWVRGVPALNTVLFVIYPWYMPLLFALAGMSARYSLARRSGAAFVKERLKKLLLPLVLGILLIIPAQTYIAEVYHNGYTGGYFAQYALFFTKPTDLTGYAGGFTPGHLWFLAYLFIISLLALPLALWHKKRGETFDFARLGVWQLLSFFLFPIVCAPILDIGGKSLSEYFALFLLGYFVLAEDAVQEKLERRWRELLLLLLALSAAFLVIDNVLHITGTIPSDIYSRLLGWAGVLAFVALGKRFLNFRSARTAYLSAAAFPFYILHQSVLVLAAYPAVMWTKSIPLQIALIIISSYLLTFGLYEAYRRAKSAFILRHR